MKSPLGILMLGVLCAIGGGVCWRLGRLEQDIASTGTLLLTLRYDTAGLNAAKASAVLAAGSSLEAARQFRATADYWSQQYDKLGQSGNSNENSPPPDPQEVFIASNARYREWQIHRGKASREASLEELQAVIKGYADVVKGQPANEDASYNYEFAVRQQEMLTTTGTGVTSPPSTGRLSIHGRSGETPKGNSTSQFKIIVPQQPDERKEDPSAGKAQKTTKKG